MPGVDSAASSCAKSETRRRLLTLGTLVSTVRFRVLLMRQIDMDHPSRIDFYGQMLQKFPEGTDTIKQKGACCASMSIPLIADTNAHALRGCLHTVHH